METIKYITKKINTTLSRSNIDRNWRSRRSVLLTRGIFRKIILLRILPTLILPGYRSTMLTACVIVTRDTVRHPRRFVFGKFVHKPNCSWSEAFVNRGLTVHLFTLCYALLMLSVGKRYSVEWMMIWKEVVIAWFEVLSRHLPEGTENRRKQNSRCTGQNSTESTVRYSVGHLQTMRC
jgi:hypothetical protein